MILKKRDLYFLLILLSLVGYAVYKRVHDKTEKMEAQTKPVSTVINKTTSGSEPSVENDTIPRSRHL